MTERLSTADIADLLGLDRHLLSASLTKQWTTYLEGQPLTVQQGRRREFEPIDVVVIDMLAVTSELGGDMVGHAREFFAEEIYAAHRNDEHRPAIEWAEVMVMPAVDGRVEISFRPAWHLLAELEAVPA